MKISLVIDDINGKKHNIFYVLYSIHHNKKMESIQPQTPDESGWPFLLYVTFLLSSIMFHSLMD